MKIKWRKNAMWEVRRLPKLVAMEERAVNGMADEANSLSGLSSYVTGSQQGRKGPSPTGGPGFQGRWRASVVTSDFDAILDNARNNTLVKVLGSGRV